LEVSEFRLSVKGMSCGHCVAAVESAIEAQGGIDSYSVSLDDGEAVVTGVPDVDKLITAIVEEGYEAILISEN
jgi:copper chaperone